MRALHEMKRIEQVLPTDNLISILYNSSAALLRYIFADEREMLLKTTVQRTQATFALHYFICIRDLLDTLFP